MAKKVAAAGPVEGPSALPDGWRWERLGSILPLSYGKALKATERRGGSVPVYGSSGVAGSHDEALCSEPALIVGRKGSAGAVFYAAGPSYAIDTAYYCSTSAARFDLRLGYHLLSFLNLRKLDQSTAVPSLSRDPYNKLIVPVPPADVQSVLAARIDELFAEVDDGEAALARARADLTTWRKALLKAAVTGELTADWRATHPPTEPGTDLLARILADRWLRWEADPKNRGKLYKQPLEVDRDILPAVPEEWTWATADQVVYKAEYGTSIKCHEAPGGPPVLRMGNIQDGGLDWRKLKYAPEDASLPMLEAGDVLFNRTNSAELLGKSAVFDGSDSPVSFASYIVAVRLTGVLPHFFSAWMNSIYGRQWIAQNKSQQVGQANLSAGTLMRMEIPVPPIAEQQRIVELIAADRARDDALGNDLDDLAQAGATLRQTILAAAFRGELA